MEAELSFASRFRSRRSRTRASQTVEQDAPALPPSNCACRSCICMNDRRRGCSWLTMKTLSGSFCGEILEGEHCDVYLAESGSEALSLFSEVEFDGVFTDVGMPGMSGWELAREIRQINTEIPIAVITGWGEALDQTSRKPPASTGWSPNHSPPIASPSWSTRSIDSPNATRRTCRTSDFHPRPSAAQRCPVNRALHAFLHHFQPKRLQQVIESARG